MELVILWIVLSVLAGVFANSRGFGFTATFIFSLVLSPLIGFISVLVRQPRISAAEPSSLDPQGSLTKSCPYCAETIKAAAVVCRYCNRDLPAGPSEAAKAELDAQFVDWLKSQKRLIKDLSNEEIAEYRQAFDYKRKQKEI